MIRMLTLWSVAILALAGCSVTQKTPSPISVVVVTGGHDFDRPSFGRMFDEMQGIQWRQFELKDDSELFEDISAWEDDVIVLYNMTQTISPERRNHFLALLDRGVGVVALHHSMVSFRDWPEYKKMIGAKYYEVETLEDGILRPASTYKHDVQMMVTIADRQHPVTAGLDDFTIRDEAYKGYALEPDNHLLLTADDPTSQKEIAWTRLYRQSRICTIQLGHGPDAYNHPAYRKLLSQAIQWTARR
jgi:type 1 glutamine amidotransferase